MLNRQYLSSKSSPNCSVSRVVDLMAAIDLMTIYLKAREGKKRKQSVEGDQNNE